jgi:hypothetical protein
MNSNVIGFSQGGESNHSGRFLEDVIEREFRARGVEVFEFVDKGGNSDLFTARMLLRNAPYTSIYGCQSRSEFLYHDDTLHSHIRIECRWQQVAGSVDEKLPYLFMNAMEAMEEREVWFVLDGGGARSQSVDWLKRKCSQVAAKDIRVFTIPEVRTRIKHLLA